MPRSRTGVSAPVVRSVQRCCRPGRLRRRALARTSGCGRARGRHLVPAAARTVSRARSAMSSTSSCRTGRSATTPTEAISRSASPRMSAAFHADRLAPSRVSTRSAATSRLIRPIWRPGSVAGLVGGVKPRSRSSLFHAATRSAPLVGHDLVGSRVRPRASVPGTAQSRPGLLVGVLGSPCGFVPVDVAVDLCGALAEPAGVRRELLDLAVVVEAVAARRERGPELGVAHHGGVTDPVERLDAVDDADRVQSTPRAAREDACVDLHVEVAVRVAGARGVVTYDGRLDHLHRHLHLSAARPDPGGGVLGHPADHLARRPIHRRVVRRRDVGMECGGERPGLRPVDDDLDEPQRACVVAQASLGRAGQHVVPGDPALVRRAVEVADALHRSGAGDVVLGQAAAFGQVVVVGARVVGLDVGARGSRRAAVELHSTVHRPRHRPSVLVI